jgi:lipopolysaccharide biosynthesis glycosyltransferase
MTIKDTDELAVVISADDGYAMQLAVAVRSILEHLPVSSHLQLFVIDGGITEQNRRRCEESWGVDTTVLATSGDPMAHCTVRWLQPDLSQLVRFEASHHFTIATYFRFFVGDLLPDHLDRVLYTDPDVLFLGDISALLKMDLQGQPLAASQDAYCPYVDSRWVLANFEQRRQGFYGLCAIPDADERGIAADQPYLNAGMLVMDLIQFRQEKLGEKLLDYCREHRDELLWADQCAINAVLGGRWLAVDAAWNVTPPVFWTDDYRDTIYDLDTFDRIRCRPAMIHFAGPEKPWQLGCKHPWAGSYREWIERTAWRGWQPAPQENPASRDRRPKLPQWLRSIGRHVWWRRGAERRAA